MSRPEKAGAWSSSTRLTRAEWQRPKDILLLLSSARRSHDSKPALIDVWRTKAHTAAIPKHLESSKPHGEQCGQEAVAVNV